GNVYVTNIRGGDYPYYGVFVFDLQGTLIGQWGSAWPDPTSTGFNNPRGIAFDGSNNVFVVDGGNTPQGGFARIKKFGAPSQPQTLGPGVSLVCEDFKGPSFSSKWDTA